MKHSWIPAVALLVACQHQAHTTQLTLSHPSSTESSSFYYSLKRALPAHLLEQDIHLSFDAFKEIRADTPLFSVNRSNYNLGERVIAQTVRCCFGGRTSCTQKTFLLKSTIITYPEQVLKEPYTLSSEDFRHEIIDWVSAGCPDERHDNSTPPIGPSSRSVPQAQSKG